MKKTVAIIGGGPSALLLAAFLDSERFQCTIYERNKAVARKFLVAGKGGFNLSHAKPMTDFVNRYTPPTFLKSALMGFTNTDLRTWLSGIGIPTFVGTSNRIFPERGIKPIEVLNGILAVLKQKNVKIQYQHQWTGWNENEALIFNQDQIVTSDYSVFALGGGSWKVTGSDGLWLDIFSKKGLKTSPFQAANCACQINWPKDFLAQHEGKPLKNIAIRCGSRQQKGEAVITQFGLEGNAIYALSPRIQTALNAHQEATIYVDLKPTLSSEKVLSRLQNSSAKKTSDILRKDLKLSKTQLQLLKTQIRKEDFLDQEILATKIKALPLSIRATAPIDEAISTTGGLSLDMVNQYFELKQLPNTFCIGEMLDWYAPTGGYLLQACFSMGVHLANHLNRLN